MEDQAAGKNIGTKIATTTCLSHGSQSLAFDCTGLYIRHDRRTSDEGSFAA